VAGADCATILPRIARGVEQAGVDPTRLIVHAANRTLIERDRILWPARRIWAVEVGYSIVPGYRGWGFATEATRAPIERAFERPGIRRITAECLDCNVASLKVFERMGMQHVSSAGETLRFERRKR
jgi:RimJ/RimL family protein N-acetyltransferase